MMARSNHTKRSAFDQIPIYLNQQKSWKKVDVMTTRFKDIVSTIRATLWKNSARNVLINITDGIGYEEIIEIWQYNPGGDNRLK